MVKSRTVSKPDIANAPFGGPIVLYTGRKEPTHNYGMALTPFGGIAETVAKANVGKWMEFLQGFDPIDERLALHQSVSSPKQYPTQRADYSAEAVVMAFQQEVLGRLEALEVKLEKITKDNFAEKTIEVRDISSEQAKSEIRAYFDEHHGEVFYADDVAEALNIDVMQAIGVCQTLMEEGSIGEEKKGQQKEKQREEESG